MTLTGLQWINRSGPLFVWLVLLLAAACADTGFSLSGWLLPAQLLARFRSSID